MTDRISTWYPSAERWQPSASPNDIQREGTCKCGATFRTVSRVRKRCEACQKLAAKAANVRIAAKAKAARKARREVMHG